jgi:hypothetical protein
MSAAGVTTIHPATLTTVASPAPTWMSASDGRTHLVSLPADVWSGHAVCGALVESRPASSGATTLCLGCRAAALAESEEVRAVPSCEPRRSRRYLHARHRWLVTRCRLVGGAR